MRIVSLVPSATDALAALGGLDLLVGVSHACEAPSGLPRVTASAVDATATSGAIDAAVREMSEASRSLFALDDALIATLKPDVIITQALCEVCAVSEAAVRALAARLSPAPRVVSISGSTLDGVFTDIEIIGSAAGLAAGAEELLLGLKRRMRTVHERLKAARAPRPRVVVVEWADPLYAGGHWVPEQVARAGAVDVLAKPGMHSRVVSAAQMRTAHPELVIVAPCGFGLDRAANEAMRLLAAHPWLGESQIWAIDANRLTSRPGPHLVDGIEIMASIFAPSLFAPVNAYLASRVAG